MTGREVGAIAPKNAHPQVVVMSKTPKGRIKGVEHSRVLGIANLWPIESEHSDVFVRFELNQLLIC
jgi:hypothetical protein